MNAASPKNATEKQLTGKVPREAIRMLEIAWPSGAVQVLHDLAVDHILTVREPSKEKR